MKELRNCGYCSVAQQIQVPAGYPNVPTRSIWLGELKGSWHDIGRQYGKAAAYYTRYVFDYWWESALLSVKKIDLLDDLHKMEEHTKLLDPCLLEMVDGEAQGAATELDKSPYALDCTHYEKFLFIEHAMSYFIHGRPNDRGAKPGKAYGTISLMSNIPVAEDCTMFAVWGPATEDGNLIVSHTQQFGWWISNYRFSFIAKPEGSYSFLCCTSPGMITGLFTCNSRGVAVGCTAGGEDPDVDSLDWGVPAGFLRLYAITHANDKNEAARIITRGTSRYREKTGRKVLLGAVPFNWLVADRDGAFVIERTPHRYAIRKPSDLNDREGFIIATNHEHCNWSYDEDGRRTEAPMVRLMGDTSAEIPGLGTFPTPGTVSRYWAIHGACLYNYGRISEQMLQGHEFTSGHHWYGRDGRKIEYLRSEPDGGWMPVYYLYPHSTVCGHSGGYPEKYHNELPAVIMYKPSELQAYWTSYKPCYWVGPWEQTRVV